MKFTKKRFSLECTADSDCSDGNTCQSNACSAPSCFSGDQKVILHDGTTRSMDKLRSGDLVRTLSDDGKMLLLTEVMIISHREENLTGKAILWHYSSLFDCYDFLISLVSYACMIVGLFSISYSRTQSLDICSLHFY